MTLSGRQSLLVVRSKLDSKKIQFVGTLSEAIPDWSGRDRASPIFEVETPKSSLPFSVGTGNAYLLFLGPLSPSDSDGVVSRLTGNHERAWLTYGLFNLLVYTTSVRQVGRFVEWADQQGVRWEQWDVKHSLVGKVSRSALPAHRPVDLLDSLSKLSFKGPMPELKDAVEEYSALLSAAGCRCAEASQELVLSELQQASTIITEAALREANQKVNGSGLLAIATLVDANAALSRFTSQMFSGSSPIAETECHFWTHSLLGTGVANLALIKIRRFITRTLGESRIPDQIRTFAALQDPRLLADTMKDGSIWNGPWLHLLPSMIEPKPVLSALDPLCPLITYLSGRDGFHTTQSSLSAPLNILTSCSNLRWSLLTITHEMSHRVVDEVLGILLPDISKREELTAAASLVSEDRSPSNLLECLQFKILDGLVKLNATEPVIEPVNDITAAYLGDLISARREEVEEIMVHVFDFIYFYGSEPRLYVPSIWRSWDAIPRLHRRLPGYVLRTLCAVLAGSWMSSSSTQDAVAAVTAGMESVEKNDKDNAYIADGLAYLRTEKTNLQMRMWLRKTFVGIVRTFLHSPAIVQSVHGLSTKRDSGVPLRFDGSAIENPLRFIETHTSSKFSVADSLWMLSRLAFDSTDPEILRIRGIHK